MMMRRLTRCAPRAAFALSTRSAHSVTVVQNVPPATTSDMLGAVVPREAVAKAHRVPVAILDKAENARVVAFTSMDLARARFAPLIATVTDAEDYNHIEHQVALRNKGDASKATPVPGALKKFKETKWTDMKTLMNFYEDAMYPIRAKHHEYADYELTSFHIKDVLKRGLSAFKQDFLDAQKKEMDAVKAKMKTCQEFIDAAVKESFDTAVCNDLANMLRVAGEHHAHAQRMALKVLEDMNMMGVAYDATTQEILRATAFDDGPFDDSALLFEVIEAPERGEVSLSQGTLEEVSAEMLKLISNRHQTPLDDGTLLRSPDTHPNLQRSPE